MNDSAPTKILKRLRQRATFWRRFCVSAASDSLSRDDVCELDAFCLFVGYPRSGSTLVASMLDAHSDILLGQELDALGFVRWGANKHQLFRAIKSSSDEFSRSLRQWEGYDYRIETPWANGYRRLRVIGDKEAAMSTIRLARDGSLISGLQETVGVPLKVIHVVRNPFDNIATMYLRGRYPILHLPLSKCIDDFAAMTRTVDALKRRLASDEFLEIRHEDVVDQPGECLANLCSFLGVKSEADHALAATKIVNPTVNESRNRLSWRASDVHRVEEIIASSSAHRSYAGTRPTRIDADAAPRSGRPTPNFLVIGAQRCGTTLIHGLLERHPEVYVPKHRKEVHFFDDHYERGKDWYGRFFPADRAVSIAIGEVSPSYLADPMVPKRIHAFDPGMRLIVMLRHPVDRLWSAYHHQRRVQGDRRSFAEFIRQDVDALERGKYAAQLCRYTDQFPREQLLAIVLEELLRDPVEQLSRIQRFLGLQQPWDVDRPDLVEKVNANFEVRFPRLYLGARRAGQFLTQRLDRGLIASYVKRSRAMALFKGRPIVEDMTLSDRSYLAEYYASDIARLKEQIGIDAALTW